MQLKLTECTISIRRHPGGGDRILLSVKPVSGQAIHRSMSGDKAVKVGLAFVQAGTRALAQKGEG